MKSEFCSIPVSKSCGGRDEQESDLKFHWLQAALIAAWKAARPEAAAVTAVKHDWLPLSLSLSFSEQEPLHRGRALSECKPCSQLVGHSSRALLSDHKQSNWLPYNPNQIQRNLWLMWKKHLLLCQFDKIRYLHTHTHIYPCLWSEHDLADTKRNGFQRLQEWHANRPCEGLPSRVLLFDVQWMWKPQYSQTPEGGTRHDCQTKTCAQFSSAVWSGLAHPSVQTVFSIAEEPEKNFSQMSCYIHSPTPSLITLIFTIGKQRTNATVT